MCTKAPCTQNPMDLENIRNLFPIGVVVTIWVSKGRREIAADDGQAWQAEILHIIRSEISRVTLGKVCGTLFVIFPWISLPLYEVGTILSCTSNSFECLKARFCNKKKLASTFPTCNKPVQY